MTRRLVAGALALAALSAPAAAHGAGVPLSADRSPADVASRFGSGAFGRWTSDTAGLPAFRYLIDQQVFPPARQPELKGATEAQHQLGNDHIVAAAFNHGYTQLWSQDRLAQWANRYDPEHGHYGGGYGYLNADGKVVSTLYLDRPRGSRSERLFGIGYYERLLRAAGLGVRERVYAPFGDDPLLLHDVTIRNTTRGPRRASWFEYWDVNPYIQAENRSRAVGAPVDAEPQDARGRRRRPAISATAAADHLRRCAERPRRRLRDVCGALLRVGHPRGPGRRGRGSPELEAPHRGRRHAARLPRAAAAAAGAVDHAALRLRHGAPRGKSPRWCGSTAQARIRSPPARPLGRLGPEGRLRARPGLGRARAANGTRTCCASASVYEEECGHHTITQGGYYQYALGANLGYRSWLHYLLPMVYTEPALAREILRFASGSSRPAEGLPYGLGGLCTRFELGTSNDLDFWLLLAAAEYGLGTRDLRSSTSGIAFADTPAKATAWEHLKLAFRHQESLRGPHGGYIMGTTGDWSDFATPLRPDDGVDAGGAQLAYAYPKLAELADLRGDRALRGDSSRSRAASCRRSSAASGPAGAGTRAATSATGRSARGRSSASRSPGRCWPACRHPAAPGRSWPTSAAS